MPVHDGAYKFLEAGEFDQTYVSLPNVISSPEFQRLAHLFRANFDRIAALHDLPIQLIAWADHLAISVATVRVNHGLAPNDRTKDHDQQLQAAAHHEFLRTAGPLDIARVFGSSQLEGMMDWEQKRNPETHNSITGVQALFAAMVTGAYVAIENLAADLWIEALNKCDSLAKNWIDRNDQKQFPSSFFGRGFNLSGSMGSLLHENRKVNFSSWGDIKNAYTTAFNGAIDSAFDPPGPIYLAEKTRHLFAHRGGLIDQKFKQEVASYPEYRTAIVGERLRLTGPIVRERVDACLTCGANLLKAVDQWVQKNP